MVVTNLIEIWRHTFPRDLRFCRQCLILHAQLAAVDKRYKDRKFIPRAELAGVIDSYVEGPSPSFLRWPILRQLFCVRGINAIRVYNGHQAWLFTPSIAIEHHKLVTWFDANGKTLWIKRDKFKEEVLDQFQVAKQFHKLFLAGVIFVSFSCLLIFAGAVSEPLVFFYLVYFKGYSREQVRDWMASVLDQHVTTEVPEAFKDALPPAAFKKMQNLNRNNNNNNQNLLGYKKSINNDSSSSSSSQNQEQKQQQQQVTAGEDPNTIYFNVVEMTSPDNNARVVFIPCPKLGPVEFYKEVGKICQTCSAVILEEVPLDYLHKMPPAFFFALDGRESMIFPSLNLHHRIYDVIEDPEVAVKTLKGAEDKTDEQKLEQLPAPPKLLPGAVKASWPVRYLLGLTPFSVRTLYAPYFLSGTKADARIGWGTIKTIVKGEGFFPTYLQHQLDVRDGKTTFAPADSSAFTAAAGGESFKPDANKTSISGYFDHASRNIQPRPGYRAPPEERKKKKKKENKSGSGGGEEEGGGGGEKAEGEEEDVVDRKNATSLVYGPDPARFDPAKANELTAERRVYPSIAVPWTVAQITNLECSLFKAGWRVTNYDSIKWISTKKSGEEFYDWYTSSSSSSKSDSTSSNPASSQGEKATPATTTTTTAST